MTYAALHQKMEVPMYQLQRLLSGLPRNTAVYENQWHKMAMACDLLAKSECRFVQLDAHWWPGTSEQIGHLRTVFRTYSCPDLLIIDELRHIEYGAAESTWDAEEYAWFCRSLRALAEEFGIPVIVFANWPRVCEKRENNHPSCRDFYVTALSRQSFDTVLFLHREAYYDPEADNTLEVIVAKSPLGNKETCRLNYHWQLGYLDEQR